MQLRYEEEKTNFIFPGCQVNVRRQKNHLLLRSWLRNPNNKYSNGGELWETGVVPPAVLLDLHSDRWRVRVSVLVGVVVVKW